MPTLVSVVVPVFNGEKYLGASLDSILGQTYSDLEVIVMDDASNDGTPEVVHSYDDPRIRYRRNERNLGQFANINEGIQLALGPFIAIQHADDVYLPAIIEREVDFLERFSDVGAVFALDLFIDPDGHEYGRAELPSEFRGGVTLDFADVLNGVLRYGNTFIRGGTSLVRREVYEDVGPFDDSYNLRGDLDMWMRISRRTRIAILDEYLTQYRWGHDHLSGRYNHLRTVPEHFFAIMDHRLASGDRAMAQPHALAAYEGRRAADLLMVTVSQYILDQRAEARQTLATVAPGRLHATRQIERWRMLALWSMLHPLVRLPRIGAIADAFARRWHGGARGRGSAP